MVNPILIIKGTPAGWSPIWNYAYIQVFQRYYFINNWTWLNGCWECDAVCDVLASFKTDIGNLSEYVVRSASESNGAISDSMYPATTDFSVNARYTPNIFATNLAIGCYIVGIISGGSVNAVGAITYYAMDSAEFGALKDKLFSDDNLEIMHIIDAQGQALVTDISQEVLKTLYNPYQYIASCMWFPFAKSAITSKTPLTGIKIGWWDYPSLTGDRLYAQIISLDESINTTDHPQAAARGKYLNYSPYSTRVLIGRFGMVAINSEYFESGEDIGIGYDIDLITGQCRCPIERRYYIGSDLHVDVLTERYFMIGVPIQIAQVGTDYLGTVSTAIQGIKGIADGISSGASSGAQLGGLVGPGGALAGGIVGGVLGGAGAAVTGIYNTLNAAMPIVETSGSNGSFLAPSTNTELLELFYTVVDDDNAQKGRPLCAVRQLNTLSGYIMVDSPDVQLPCMETERQQIASYMSGGFFYE